MAITIDQLTERRLDGNGIFDALMDSVDQHIQREYKANRIKGPEYATVYLGAVQATLQQSLEFLLTKDKTDKEIALIEAQISKMAKEEALVDAQILNAGADKLRIEADTARLTQQTANLLAEAANIPKQGQLIDAQIAKAGAETDLTTQRKTNLEAEALNIPKQGLVLDAQKCKLDAEFDLLVEQKAKAIAETALLNQKKVTEQAQTSATGVDADSVVGKQKALYTAQTNGFLRDAEQNVAKIMVDTWNVRRTTDSGVVADATNKLDDVTIGRAIDKLLAGVGA